MQSCSAYTTNSKPGSALIKVAYAGDGAMTIQRRRLEVLSVIRNSIAAATGRKLIGTKWEFQGPEFWSTPLQLLYLLANRG